MANATTKSPAKRTPAAQFYLGDTVTSVFKDQRTADAGRTWNSYSVSQQRRYYDAAAKQAKYSDSLFDGDVLAAAEGLRQAFSWIEADRRIKPESTEK